MLEHNRTLVLARVQVNGRIRIMAYTEFGEFFRILRIKNHEVLADAKEFLGVSSAFISSVECGKKGVPEDWVEKIICHYNLSQEDYLKKWKENFCCSHLLRHLIKEKNMINYHCSTIYIT